VGQFALGLAVATPVITFTNLHLREVQATDARGEHGFDVYLGLRLLTVGVALLAIGALTWIAGFRRETALVVLLAGLVKAVDAVADVVHGFFQQRERMDLVARSMLLRGPASLAALALVFAPSGSVPASLAAMAGASALILVAYDAPRAGQMLSGCPDLGMADRARLIGASVRLAYRRGAALRRLAWTTLPLGIVMMLISLNLQVPRYFIEGLMGAAALGIYAALAYAMMAGATVVAALGQSASASLARTFAEGDRAAFCRLLGGLVALGGALGVAGVIVAWLGGRTILSVLYRPEYAEHVESFVWLMGAGALWNVGAFLGHGVMATRRFAALVPLHAAATIIMVLACAALVPAAGLVGAAIAAAISLAVQVGGGLVVVACAVAALPVSRGHLRVAAEAETRD
jgi:O-antigen/teichoic acid export membrane protein